MLGAGRGKNTLPATVSWNRSLTDHKLFRSVSIWTRFNENVYVDIAVGTRDDSVEDASRNSSGRYSKHSCFAAGHG